jgi:hypothetical protein
MCRCTGGVAEWSKALAWKAGTPETVSWVRIPLPPPAVYRGALSEKTETAWEGRIPLDFETGLLTAAAQGAPEVPLRRPELSEAVDWQD